MSIVTEVSTKQPHSSEKHDMSKLEATFKRFNEVCDRHDRTWKRTREHILEIAERGSKEHAERKETKGKQLKEIESKINVIFYGFENVKRVSDESVSKVDSIAARMDAVLNDVAMMREECEAKDAEILRLNSRIDKQDKEIEMLKLMIAEQKRMLELYIQFNAN